MLRQRPKKFKKILPQTTPESDTSSPRRSSRLSKNAVSVTMDTDTADDPRKPLLSSAKAGASLSGHHPQDAPSSNNASSPAPEEEMLDLHNMSRKSQWIILAVASGCCAAFNGVFAKL
jgi:hypothetical protein